MICEEAIKLVKDFEGCYLTTYTCPAGVLTIGYGHTGHDVKKGMKITRKQAEELLIMDLITFEKEVRKQSAKYNWNENQVGALTSFAFNCGIGNFKKLIKNRNNDKIALNIIKYNKANGKVLLGLERRRKAEQALFLKPTNQTRLYASVPCKAYNSIVDALKSVNVDSSYANRKRIAQLNGMNDYNGKVLENVKLLAILYSGKLVIE